MCQANSSGQYASLEKRRFRAKFLPVPQTGLFAEQGGLFAEFGRDHGLYCAVVSDEVPRFAGQFSTTRWSVVLAAGQEVSPESAAALEKLCRAYWQPVCVFAQRKGWSE